MIPIVLNDEATCPTRAHHNDAGLDLYSIEEVIFPGIMTELTILNKKLVNLFEMFYSVVDARNAPDRSLINKLKYEPIQLPKRRFKTGVHTAIPDGYVGFIKDKSGMGDKGIKVFGGVIDAPYRGEIEIVLWNFGETVTIAKGQKLAQLVILPINSEPLMQVDQLDQTDRGHGGFGSTGL
jgi:dUTP pyrophosphatase